MNLEKTIALTLSSHLRESNEMSSNIESTSEKEKVTYDFGNCKVCNDKASGIHYGVASCEGCKGFYTRAMKKRQTYKCLDNNSCKVIKNNRNRCKSCRLEKCLKSGMSLDVVKMGRITKSEKLKSKNDKQEQEKEIACTSSNLNKEIVSLIILNRNHPINKFVKNTTLYFPKEFKVWLNSQLNFLKTIETDLKYNLMTLAPNSFEIIEPLDTFNDIDVFSLPLVTSYNTDQIEIIMLSFLKDKVYELFKRHIRQSFILNDTRERLKNKEYKDAEDNIPIESINRGIGLNVFLYSQWLNSYIRDLPGLNKFDSEDLNALISNCSLLSIAIHVNEFYTENECYQIANGIQLTRNRLNLSFGTFMTCLFFMINNKIQKLNLSESETSVFYPFSLFSQRIPHGKDKNKFYKYKMVYTKLLIYTLKINGRDAQFLKEFKELESWMNRSIKTWS